jgi:hypothetical protein
MSPREYLDIIYDCLFCRGKVVNHRGISYLMSSSNSYYSTVRARGAIGMKSLLNLRASLTDIEECDLVSFLDMVIERRL